MILLCNNTNYPIVTAEEILKMLIDREKKTEKLKINKKGDSQSEEDNNSP